VALGIAMGSSTQNTRRKSKCDGCEPVCSTCKSTGHDVRTLFSRLASIVILIHCAVL
jgi:hypothetical protein